MHRLITRTLVAAGCLLLLPAVLSATITTVSVAGDTYVKENRPWLVFGSETRMEVRAYGSFGTGFGRHSFVQFNVPALQAPIHSAKLRVKTGSAMPSVGLFYLPNATFSEYGVSWNSMGPHIAGNVWVQDQGPAAAETWMEYNVLGFIQSGSTVYFGLTTGSDVVDQWFYTKEFSTANAAQLVIDHGTTGTPNLVFSRADAWYRPGYSSLGNLQSVQVNHGRTASIVLTNNGTGPLTLSGPPSISGDAGLTLSAPSYPSSLGAGQSYTLTATVYSPTMPADGRIDGTLTVPTAQLGNRILPLYSYISQGRDCDPGPVQEDLTRVLAGEESSTVICWNDAYTNFQWGGSQNIPLITNAVRLWALNEPSVASFFYKYANAAVSGAAGGAGQPPARFRYLLPEELGSMNYDPISITGVLAARAWAQPNNDPGLKSVTRSWLRAYLTLAAAATTPSRTDFYVDEGSTYSPFPGGYVGPSVLLAGQRNCPENWGFTTRPRLVGRALGLSGNAQGAAGLEDLWTTLEVKWAGAPSSDGSLFGLLSSEASALVGLVNGASCSAISINTWLSGIATQARIDVAGWRNAAGWGSVRAATSGAINQVNLFGEAFVPAARGAFPANSVYVLYPWANPPYPACAGTSVDGSVQMILSGDKRLVYTPTSGAPLTVDLPDEPHWFSLTMGPTGGSFTCTP